MSDKSMFDRLAGWWRHSGAPAPPEGEPAQAPETAETPEEVSASVPAEEEVKNQAAVEEAVPWRQKQAERAEP